jgi:NADH-quinone oxidoreductase subunit C
LADENQKEQHKKEAAARAKAAALAKLNRKDLQSEKTQVIKESKDRLGPKIKISAKTETPKNADKTKAMDEVEKTKANAIAKAKAAAVAKAKLSQQTNNIGESSESSVDETAKTKATAIAKAKAVAATKAKSSEQQSKSIDGTLELPVDEKTNAIAIAKAKAIAAAKAKLAAQQQPKNSIELPESINNEKSKAIAIAKAKAKAVTAQVEGNTLITENTNSIELNEEKIEISSVNQPLLEFVKKEAINALGDKVIEDSYINKLSKDVPTFLVDKSNFLIFAKFLKENESLQFEYLNLLHGTDFQTHFEVYVHLHSYRNGYEIALKTKLDSENPELDSLTSIWTGASWPESEAYDLLGIKFNGNSDLHRIFLGENWVGYPLRKDYQPYDEEVVSE